MSPHDDPARAVRRVSPIPPDDAPRPQTAAERATAAPAAVLVPVDHTWIGFAIGLALMGIGTYLNWGTGWACLILGAWLVAIAIGVTAGRNRRKA